MSVRAEAASKGWSKAKRSARKCVICPRKVVHSGVEYPENSGRKYHTKCWEEYRKKHYKATGERLPTAAELKRKEGKLVRGTTREKGGSSVFPLLLIGFAGFGIYYLYKKAQQ